jgi:pantoate--beta-alanine ligase
MIIIHRAADLAGYVRKASAAGKKIGFVPTMGALHRGHLSLIEASRNDTGFTVCSIFVNPTQFNNAEDLKKYPRTVEKDIDMLEGAGCDLLFLPEPGEIYPEKYAAPHFDLGNLETVLEGKFRPGHFQGVCQVVDILLEIVKPDRLYLGEKDFQQCLVIKKLVALTNRKTEIGICSTLRENGGLAMSSRNMRLSEIERQQALAIFQTLNFLKKELQPGSLHLLKARATALLEKSGLRPEYVEIARAADLTAPESWDGKESLVALIACYAGEVRLIDNMTLD